MSDASRQRPLQLCLVAVLAVVMEGALFVSAGAQETRLVEVDGRDVRVRTAGLDRRGDGTPVMVFEAGFMNDGLSAWTSILSEVAEFAPVVAYDRAGIGGSEPDGQVPTAGHVAENLHRLLSVLGADPPYVLVGHSLGGPFIRMFVELYPDEVSGLVFIDPTPTTSEQDRRDTEAATGLTASSRSVIADMQRAQLPGMPSASVRAEAEMLINARINHFPEFQGLGALPDVPTAILMSARYEPRPDDGLERACEPRQCHDQEVAIRREWLARQLTGVRQGWLTVVTDSGHFIQNDDSELVVWTIRRVWSREPLRAELQLDPTVLDQLVGSYRRNSDTSLIVTREGDQLFAQITGQAPLPIFAETESQFYYRAVAATLAFERSPGGSVAAVILAQGARESRWERVQQR